MPRAVQGARPVVGIATVAPFRTLPSAPCNQIAPGYPERRVTALSAATFAVLTRFARTRPPDLGRNGR